MNGKGLYTSRHLERRLPVSGRESCPACHPERSEGSGLPDGEILRFAQDDRHYLQMSIHEATLLTPVFSSTALWRCVQGAGERGLWRYLDRGRRG